MSKTKTLIAAVLTALSVAVLAPAPTALACGGYGSIHPEQPDVVAAITQFVERRGDARSHSVLRVSVRDERAFASVALERAPDEWTWYSAALERSAHGWRVVRWDPQPT